MSKKKRVKRISEVIRFTESQGKKYRKRKKGIKKENRIKFIEKQRKTERKNAQ